jgi:hypothetical protein
MFFLFLGVALVALVGLVFALRVWFSRSKQGSAPGESRYLLDLSGGISAPPSPIEASKEHSFVSHSTEEDTSLLSEEGSLLSLPKLELELSNLSNEIVPSKKARENDAPRDSDKKEVENARASSPKRKALSLSMLV